MNNSSPSTHNLLSNLKSIVELVIKFPGDSLTSQYGAIERIRSAILSILLHGLKQNTKDIYEQLWQLIVRLNSNSQKYIRLLQDIYHKENLRISVEQWIDQSIITQCLSQQLSHIENDIDTLEHHYYSHAFMRILPFYNAFMICIRTIEFSDPSLLANIDPKLSIVGLDHPTISTNDIISRAYSSTTLSTLNNNNNNNDIIKKNLFSDDNQQKPHSIVKQRILHRRIHSDPVFHFDSIPNTRSSITSSLLHNEIKLNEDEDIPNISYSYQYSSSYESRTNSFLSIEQSLPIESNRQSISSQITLINDEDRLSQRFTIISDTIPDMYLPYSSLFWPRQGQSLYNYIRECDAQTRTDVEKENAHFYFSEAIISAIEYIKFSEKCKKYIDLIDENTINMNYDNSFEHNSISNSLDLSAEGLALSIMETWKNYKIPPASELLSMISHENDIIRELTPIQEDKTPEQHDDHPVNQRLLRRGNSQWSPPREQLIFHIHQSVNRNSQLKKQGYLCAGCGRDAEKGYTHLFRYCEYTGKYYCRSCHMDKKFYLPSYIITKWEFSNKHSVSDFAFDYLNRIYSEPIFDINDLNSKLFEKSQKLKIMNELRWSLYFLRYYILTCRFAEENKLQETLTGLSTYIYEQPHTYSLEDLVKTKSGDLQKILEPIVVNLRHHVLTCTLCYPKGFICEICKNEKSIIFPFNFQTTSVCRVCQSCFHIQCHKNKKYQCPKCQRTKHRNTLTSSNRSDASTNV